MCSFAGAHHYELWTTWVAHQGGPLSPSSCGGQNETMKPEPKPEIWNDLDTVLVMFWEEYLEIDQNQRDVAKSVVHWFCMLVGGLVAMNFIFPSILGMSVIIPIDELHHFSGRGGPGPPSRKHVTYLFCAEST